MPSAALHFFPLAHPFILGLLFVLGLLIALIEIGLIGYADEKMGVQRRYVFAVPLLSLLGSYVNIPVAELPAERIVSGQEVIFFGMHYVIPLVEEWPQTVLAVNVGGAVILARDDVLRPELPTRQPPLPRSPARSSTLADVQRDYIRRVLRDTSGVIVGPQGAAARLGVKRTTLLSRMERLGIARQGAVT